MSGKRFQKTTTNRNSGDKVGIYCSDFETTTQTNYDIEGEVRVWGYATIEVGDYENFTYGNNIDSFM